MSAQLPRPRVFRIVRLWSLPGRGPDLMNRVRVAAIAAHRQNPDVPFRSYLAATHNDDVTEILAASVWDRPEDLRAVFIDRDTGQPLALDTFKGALARFEVTSYEVYWPAPPLDGEVPAVPALWSFEPEPTR